MTRATVSAYALLPIRAFFGITFLYAGLDKLLDPAFFDPSAPTSLHAQLEGFSRLSPLGDLIRASLPFVTPIGLLIAIAEIGIGIGALTGLAYRIAAAGGAAISLLLFLTASWATHPYYLGNDLPYLFGWLALAIAGHGGLLVPKQIQELDELGFLRRAEPRVRDLRPSGRSRRRRLAAREAAREQRSDAAVGYGYSAAPQGRVRRATSNDEAVPSPERRALLQTGILAAAAAIVASFALPLRALGIVTEHGPTAATGAPTPTLTPGSAAGATPAPGATAAIGPTTPPGGTAIAKVADVRSAGAAPFQVPQNAPSTLPAGDPGIVVQLADGSFVAFDAVCTHQGCTVEYDQPDRLLVCPCHSAVFDPAHDAAVLGGPAPSPLQKLPIVVDNATGEIYLSA
ncbi:MAG TPA: Rieske (2Fe-2S) protein [Candidatus Binatus sp.]|nr:Rieske (2Fe-2S) protein [Candidatus Binatus sp.]